MRHHIWIAIVCASIVRLTECEVGVATAAGDVSKASGATAQPALNHVRDSCEAEDSSCDRPPTQLYTRHPHANSVRDDPKVGTRAGSTAQDDTKAESVASGTSPKVTLMNHSPPTSIVQRLAFPRWPTSTEFLRTYVEQNTPVVFEGAASLLGRPMDFFEDDDGLRECCGDEDVSVDPRLEDQRLDEALEMPFADYLDGYKKNPWYLIVPTPKGLKAKVPPMLTHPTILNVYQFSNLWMNNGGGKSLLHYDSVEGVFCVVAGVKEVMLIEPRHSTDIPIDRSDGDFCAVNVTHVDPNVYRGVLSAPWISASLSAGDCLYIPAFWLHYIRSEDRSVSMNLWWSPRPAEVQTESSQAPGMGHEDQSSLLIRDVPLFPVKQLKALVRELLRQLGPLPIPKLRECILHEHTQKPLFYKLRLASMDTNQDGSIDVAEWDAETILTPFFKRRGLEPSAIDIVCRPKSYHIRAAEALRAPVHRS